MSSAPYQGYVPPPPRALNGGLYTGEPFKENAPWANVPVVPDVDYMNNVNLRSANPPPQALYQYQGNVRPGNNYQNNTGLTQYKGSTGFADRYNFKCIPCEKLPKTRAHCMCVRAASISGNSVGSDCTCGQKIFVNL